MTLDFLFSPFTEYLFMKKALFACLGLSITSGPVGLLLLLRKMSLMGEALSHGIFPGIVISFLVFGFWLPGFVFGAIAIGLSLSLLSRYIHEHSLLHEDASFSGLYLFSLALGVLLLHSYNGNFNLLHLLFGNILSIQNDTLIYISLMNGMVLGILYLFRKPILYDCFDPVFVHFSNKSRTIYHLIIWGSITTLLVSASLAVGTLMSMGLIILPVITARLLFKNIWAIILNSSLIGIAASYIGLLISFYYSIPSGSTIISILGLLFLIVFFSKQT